MKIVDTGNHYGNMNTAASFYPKNTTKEYRTQDFLARRILLGNDEGFDGHKVFIADQKDQSGTYHILGEEDVKKAPNGWAEIDIDEDILVVTDKAPGIVAAHAVADCPVVMVSDYKNGVTAVCHCSGALVDKMLPTLTVDALLKAEKDLGMDYCDQNIGAYISACAGPNWQYNNYPGWATDESVWKNSIMDRGNGIFNINIRQAVLEQFNNRGVKNVNMKLVDTITSPDYYSHSASFNDPTKAGRNLIGAFYPEVNFQMVKKR